MGCRVRRIVDDVRRKAAAGGAPRRTRRLSDTIVIAVHHACDQGDFEVAARLLHVLETMLERLPPGDDRRRNTEPLVAALERLWNLRHPNAEIIENRLT
jgi:hypothetical protein